jgi:hypothetical protein
MSSFHARPSDADVLFQPIQVGDLNLPNRVAMAPLTRNRASAGLITSPKPPRSAPRRRDRLTAKRLPQVEH